VQVAGFPPRTRVTYAALGAAALTAFLTLLPHSGRLIAAVGARTGIGPHALGFTVRKLVLSDQARRFLVLQYRSYATEFMGCLIGDLHGSTVVVRRIAPADVEPTHSTATRVVPTQSCEDAGWSATVGMVHSHPDGDRCWYFFPGTQVLSSDGQSFLQQPYPVDAIMCGDHLVWIGRDMNERQLRPLSGAEAKLVRTDREGATSGR
jgi:JAB domain-containing protein similar to deubiquitination enzymes